MTDEELGNELYNAFLNESASACGAKARELLAKPVATREAMHAIRLTEAEIQSGHDRVKWAEGLIRQLPLTHDGRNSWLLNHGMSAEADGIRARQADKTGKTMPIPNGPEAFASSESLDRLCDGALRRSAKIVDPPPPEGLPSVTDIENVMRNEHCVRGNVAMVISACARVARVLLEKHARQRMMIDGMTRIDINDEFRRHMNLKAQQNLSWTDTLLSSLASVAHRLATTPAPAVPKVDPDAGAKAAHALARQHNFFDHNWDTYGEDVHNYFRDVAAKQVKP